MEILNILIHNPIIYRIYTGNVLAQLMFNSSQALMSLPISLLHKMATVMKEASEVDPERVRDYEARRHIVWRSFSYLMETNA